MCVIVELKPRQSLTKVQFENMVYNNEDGFSLVVRDKKKFIIIQKTKKELDVDEHIKLVDKYIDKTRYIHVRNNTAGDNGKENLHPFNVGTEGKPILFFHNGTLHNYKPVTSDNDDRSDSRVFAEDFLKPYLDASGGYYSDSIHLTVLSKFWTGDHNRGLIISHNQPDLILNKKNWVEIKGVNGDKINASNDSYFDKLTRGEEYERRKKILQEKSRATHGYGANNVVLFDSPSTTPNFKIEDVVEDLVNLWDDLEIYEGNNTGLLAAVTLKEWDDIVHKHKDDAAVIMSFMASEIGRLAVENDYLESDLKTVEDKHKKATDVISKLKGAK